MEKNAPRLILFQNTLWRWARPQGTAPYLALCSAPLLNTPTLSEGRANSPRTPAALSSPPSPHCMQVLPSGSHSQCSHLSRKLNKKTEVPLSGEAALASVQGQEELTPAMVQCKTATRRCKSKQASQLRLQSFPQGKQHRGFQAGGRGESREVLRFRKI